MSKTMLINTVEHHECRIAILDGKRLEELYTERASAASQVGNIYKGRVTNIEPSIQAAFIDFGGIKNGFLHISDLHPQYFPKSKKSGTEQVGRRTAHKTRPPIQDCLRRGQEVVVQMTKEGIGTKGPTLTTYLSIPGRMLVMMPGMSKVGVSRKIEDDEARGKTKKILDELDIPSDMGIIVRTAGVGKTKRDLQRDLSYLTRLWNDVQKRIERDKAPEEIYKESDLVTRTIRDVFDNTITEIICDTEDITLRVKDFLDVAVPRAKCNIQYYQGARGLFEEYGVEEEIQKVHAHRVELPGGGSLIIDQTEALVAIDVNSGSFRAHSNAEDNACDLNMQAAEEIGRQLRLRDMGGVIIIDFVDMRYERNRRTLEKKLRDVLKKDRAKSKVLRISSFGIVEMTRQRLRPSLKQSIYACCPTCEGTGQIMSQESVALEVLRRVQVACTREDVATLEVTVSPAIANHLINSQRNVITDLENETGKRIVILADPAIVGHDVTLQCADQRGTAVASGTLSRKTSHAKDKPLVNVTELLGKRKKGTSPKDESPKDEQDDSADGQSPDESSEGSAKSSRKRRGRRGGRKHKKKSDDQPKDESKQQPSKDTGGDEQKKQDDSDDKQESGDDASKDSTNDSHDQPKKKPRRRGRRGGRKHRKKTTSENKDNPDSESNNSSNDSDNSDSGKNETDENAENDTAKQKFDSSETSGNDDTGDAIQW